MRNFCVVNNAEASAKTGRTVDMATSTNGRPTREAVYARVSKEEGQEAENQLLVLRGEVERDGHELVEIYVDRESGRRGKRERSDFARMFRDAERRRFDVLRFWALDRFSREGIRKTLGYLQQLDHLGVRFRSHTEPYLNTDNELLAHIVLGVTSYYAQLEAVRISDRTKAGLARARAQGKVIGRPDGFERWRNAIAGLRADKLSNKEICRRTGLSYNTLKKYLARMEAESAAGGGNRAEIVFAPGDGGPPTVAEAKISRRGAEGDGTPAGER